MKNEIKGLMNKKPANFVSVVKENLDRKRDAVLTNKSYIFSQEVASSFNMEHVNESVEKLDEGRGPNHRDMMKATGGRGNLPDDYDDSSDDLKRFKKKKMVRKDNVEPGEEAPDGEQYYTEKPKSSSKLVAKAHAHVKKAFKLLRKMKEKGLNEEEELELKAILNGNDVDLVNESNVPERTVTVDYNHMSSGKRKNYKKTFNIPGKDPNATGRQPQTHHHVNDHLHSIHGSGHFEINSIHENGKKIL